MINEQIRSLMRLQTDVSGRLRDMVAALRDEMQTEATTMAWRKLMEAAFWLDHDVQMYRDIENLENSMAESLKVESAADIRDRRDKVAEDEYRSSLESLGCDGEKIDEMVAAVQKLSRHLKTT